MGTDHTFQREGQRPLRLWTVVTARHTPRQARCEVQHEEQQVLQIPRESTSTFPVVPGDRLRALARIFFKNPREVL